MKYPAILLYFPIIVIFNVNCTIYGTKSNDKGKINNFDTPPKNNSKTVPTTTIHTTVPTTPNITEKYKTIEDLILAIKNGDTITEEIAKKFAAKQAPNSISDKQIYELANSGKVNEKVLMAIAEKAIIGKQEYFKNRLPNKVIAKIIENTPNGKIGAQDLNKVYNKYSDIDIKSYKKLASKINYPFSEDLKNDLNACIPHWAKQLHPEILEILIDKIPDNAVEYEEEASKNYIDSMLIKQESTTSVRKKLLQKIKKYEASEEDIKKCETILTNILDNSTKEQKIQEDEMALLLEKLMLSDSYIKDIEKTFTALEYSVPIIKKLNNIQSREDKEDIEEFMEG
jgi:hypothetical protein